MDGGAEGEISCQAILILLMRISIKQISALSVCLIFSGCVFQGATPIEWQEPGPEMAWPAPPEKPRVRYLRSLSGASDFVDRGTRASFMRWLTGAQKQVLPLVSPYGLAADGKGRVWVADNGAAAVQIIDIARRRVEYIVQAGETRLLSPVGVAVDSERQRLYISDAVLNRVFAFDLGGQLQQEVLPPDGFGRPGGMAVDSEGSLYVVDVVKARISVFGPNGQLLRTIVSGAPPDFTFKLPSNVAIGRNGLVFVVDTMNFRIEVFDRHGKSLRTIGSVGDVPGTFGRPRGIAVDGDGHVYVGDALFDNLQIFDEDGNLLLFWGERGTGPGKFSLPAGLCFDHENRLYVADVYNQRIQIYQYLSAEE